MAIILARLGTSGWSYGSSLASAKHCRLDPSSSQHSAYVDDEGVFHYQHIDLDSSTVTTLLRFELQFTPDADAAPYEPVSKPWAFEFVPGAPGDLLLVQEGSCRILYASLPKQGTDSSSVFLFGSHTAPVGCIHTNGNLVLSGCSAGVLKLWRLSDGQLADVVTLPDGAITAISTLGPLLVAVGCSSSTVTMYDIASGRLLAVQRLMAGPGPVQCMAAWLPSEVLAGVNLAPGGPLGPDGGGVLPAGAWDAPNGSTKIAAASTTPGPGATRQQSRTLLAVASSTGWLCVFGTAQHGSQPWSIVHSTGNLIAPGTHTQLAFSPDGTTLAVASPAAQLLGTDAVALVAAGGQPGAVSLYQVADSSSGPAALLPPLLMQQQQLPELLLWHQWSLCSMPAGLAVLPSSELQLLHGKQLHPSQVLRLYVVPQVGPAQVLTAERRLISAARSSSSPAQAGAPTAAKLGGFAARTAAAETGRVSTAAAPPPAASEAAVLSAGCSSDRQQQQQADAHARSSDGCSSSSSKREEADEALLLNIAERDLAEVADAIAAAAGPSLDAELAALLAGMTAAGMTAPAAAAGQLAGGGSAGTAPTPAAAAVQKSADASAADGTAKIHAEISNQQEHEQHSGRAQAAGSHGRVQSAASASQSDTAPGAAAAAGSSGLRLPQTLPGMRSWRGADAAAGGGAGWSPSLPSGAPGLAALAQSLREEQQLLAQQQQQQEEEQQQREQQEQQQREHQEQQQRREQQEQQERDAATAQADSWAQVAHRAGGLTGVTDGELPSESSFQHMLQQEQWSNMQPPPDIQQQQQQRRQEAQQQQQFGSQQQLYREGSSTGGAQHSNLLSGPPPKAAAAGAAAAVAAAGTCCVRPVPAAAGMAAAAPSSEPEPQPRKLPTMLLQQRTAAGQQLPQHPAAQMGVGLGVPPGRLFAHRAADTQSSYSSSAQGPPAAALRKSSRPAGARAGVGLGEPLQAGAVQQTVADQLVEGGGELQQQQPRQQQQQSAPRQRDTQRLAPLSVKERLAARRQEALAMQQQQRAAAAAMTGAGAPVAAAGPGVQRGPGVAGGVLPGSDHPLAAAVQNSSRLLAAKIQEAERAPDVTVDPLGPAALKLAVARLADLDLPLQQQQYSYEALADLRDVPTPTHAPKLVQKQLDAHWVASRSIKPCMDTLFRPQDWQQGFVDPQVLLLPAWPSPRDVVQQLL